MMAYLLLALAIVAEIIGATMLKKSNGFSSKLPIVGIVLGYGFAFYLLSLVLLEFPLGFTYAVWCGLGTVLTVVVGIWLFKEKVNKKGVLGMCILILEIVLLILVK